MLPDRLCSSTHRAGLLPLAPALLVLALILSFAGDVPLADEWDTPGELLEQATNGNATWKHFFDQHTESRMVVPRLVFLLGTVLFGWHVIPYMVLGWLFALASLLLLLKMLAADPRGEGGQMLSAALLLACLLFSPMQVENQLWGIQMIVFIPPLCLVASLWVQSTKAPYRNVVLWCALFSLIATFSFANGMLCWILAFPLLRYWLSERGAIPRQQRRNVRAWTAVYLALAALSTLAYFWGYHKPVSHPSLDVVLEDPALGLRFLVTWLGTPLAGAHGGHHMDSASLVGTALLLTLSVVSACILYESDSGSPRWSWLPYYPWICITAFGLLSGLAITVTRAGVGQAQATSGRYSTLALWVVIGLVGMVAALWRSQAGRRRSYARPLCLLVAVALCCLTITSWIAGLRRFEEAGHRADQHRLTLRLLEAAPANPLIGCGRPDCLYPMPGVVVRRAAILIEAGTLSVDSIGPWLAERLSSPTAVGPGEFRIIDEGEVDVRVVGWAALPGEDRPPDFIALTCKRGGGRFELISGLIVKDHLHGAAPGWMDAEQGGALFQGTLATPCSDAEGLGLFAVDLSSEQVYGLTNPAAS